MLNGQLFLPFDGGLYELIDLSLITHFSLLFVGCYLLSTSKALQPSNCISIRNNLVKSPSCILYSCVLQSSVRLRTHTHPPFGDECISKSLQPQNHIYLKNNLVKLPSCILYTGAGLLDP